MNRILIAAAFTGFVLNTATADAQSWVFQPGTYSKTYGPKASDSAAKQPHAYATFTESQAAQAAKLPKPAFQWDSTGLGGRSRRFQMWDHQEAMEANRLRTYAQGVRDAVGAPIWTWNGPSPQAIPQIVAPTAKSPGQTRSAPRP
jgi:hypothetical protein